MAPRFQAGGGLRADALYVERPADRELLDRLREREFCYVLAPRQQGKTSLRYRTASALRRQSREVVHVDLSFLGGALPEGTWYLAVLERIADRLDHEMLTERWASLEPLPPADRWLRLLAHLVATLGERELVVFIDEIDIVRTLSFSADDFFAAIRSVHDRRPDEPLWERVTFCLLGVARPTDLIVDPRRTPFNVGSAIRIEDFTPEEAASLLPGLAHLGEYASAALDEVMRWTKGHPYMTQRLCHDLVRRGITGPEAAGVVRSLVEELFWRDGEHGDGPMVAAAKMLRAPGADDIVTLYRRVLTGARLSGTEADPAVAGLLLSGLVARRRSHEGAALELRNPILAHVFGLAWVEELEGGRRPLTAKVRTWLAGLAEGRDPEELLLEGDELEAALAWANWAHGKVGLTPEESRLLVASQERERRARIVAAEAAEVARKDAEARRDAAATDAADARRLRLEAEIARLEQVEATRRAEARAATERAAAQRRFIRALGVTLGVLALAAIALAWLGIARSRALEEAVRSRSEAERALAGAKMNVALLSASQARELLRLPEALRGMLNAIDPALGDDQPGQVWNAVFTAIGEQRLVYPDAVLWTGPTATRKVAESPVGAGIAATDDDGRVLLLTGSGISALRGATGASGWALAWSPVAAILAVASGHDVLLWNDPEHDPAPRTLAGHADDVGQIAFTPDGRSLVSRGKDPTIRIWDIPSGKLRAALPLPAQATAMALTPDGSALAAAVEGGPILRWALPGGRRLRDWKGTHSWVVRIRYAHDGVRLAGASDLGAIHVWERDGLPRRLLEGASTTTWDLAWSGDDRSLVAAARDGTVQLWDVPSATLRWQQRAHRNWAHSPSFDPDGRSVLTAGTDGSVVIQDAEDGRPTRVLLADATEGVTTVARSTAGEALLTTSYDGRILRWSLPPSIQPTDGCPCTTPLVAQQEFIWSACGADVHRWAKGGRADRAVSLRDACATALIATNEQVLVGDTDGAIWSIIAGNPAAERTAAVPGSVSGLWSLPSGLLVSWRSNQGTEYGLVPRAGAKVVPLVSGGVGPKNIAPAPDGTLLTRRAPVRPLVETIAIPDDTQVATWSTDGSRFAVATDARVVQVRDRAGVGIGPAHEADGDWMQALRFSPDGRRLAAAPNANAAVVWDVETGDVVQRLTYPYGYATDLAFHPERPWLLATSASQHAWIWDLETGAVINLPAAQRPVTSAVWSADGAEAWTATAEGDVQAWPVTLEGVRTRICTLVPALGDVGTAASWCRR